MKKITVSTHLTAGEMKERFDKKVPSISQGAAQKPFFYGKRSGSSVRLFRRLPYLGFSPFSTFFCGEIENGKINGHFSKSSVVRVFLLIAAAIVAFTAFLFFSFLDFLPIVISILLVLWCGVLIMLAFYHRKKTKAAYIAYLQSLSDDSMPE